MDSIAQMRKTSVRMTILPGVLVIAIALALFFMFGCQNLFKMLSPKSFADLSAEQIDGVFIEDDVNLLYGSYLEEEQLKSGQRSGTGTVTGIQYLIMLNDKQLIGLFIHKSDMDRAEKLMDASEAYFNDKLDPDELPSLHVKGTMTPMDSQERSYYYSALDLKDTPEVRETMLPYYLDVGRIDGTSFSTLYIVSAISLVLIAFSLFRLIKAMAGGYQKQVLERLKNTGSQDMAREALDWFYGETAPVAGVRLGREFVLFQLGVKSILLRPWEVAWVYQRTTSHRTNGIPTGKSYTAVLNTMDGKQFELNMKNEPTVQTLLTAIRNTMPGTALGYSKELDKLYKENRDAFAAHWEEVCPGCTKRA